MTYWEFKGRELVNCTCEYGCNCQFNALPDKGHCYAVAGIQIDEGHHGDTRLDGLKIGAIFKWPGAIHEGNGEALAFVDKSANDAQRDALLKIMTGHPNRSFRGLHFLDQQPHDGRLARSGAPDEEHELAPSDGERRLVKTHISHIFGKLGVRNRAELTREAARRE